jgi:hypothetical protein
MATGWIAEDLEFESQQEHYFLLSTSFSRALRITQPVIQWVKGYFPQG